jgi:hypothetical protein
LELISTVLWGVAIVSLAVLGAAAGATVVQRLVPVQMRKTNNAAIGIIFGGLYVLFGTMVGFTAFLVLDKYNVAHEAVARPATWRSCTTSPGISPNRNEARSGMR